MIELENVYYYESSPNLNKFSTKDSEFEKINITKNPQLFVKLASCDTRTTNINLQLEAYMFEFKNKFQIINI